MKIKAAVIFTILLITIEFLLGISLLQATKIEPFDLVWLNDALYTCQKEWEPLVKGGNPSLPKEKYIYGIFDKKGKLLYASDEKAGEDIKDLIQNRNMIFTIQKEEKILGSFIVINDERQRLLDNRDKQFLLLMAAGGAAVIFLWSYLFYVRKVFFLPFFKLEAFAKRVAQGNLELPLSMDKENVFGAFTESFDLMREELKKAREKEREACESKKELVAKLSHDIKTPVASIKAVAELLEVKTVKEQEKKQLGIILAKSTQIESLVSNLFHATLEELQELRVFPTEENSEIIYDMIALADYERKAHVNKIPTCLVKIDSLRFQQVLDNIFINAYKYAGTEMEIEVKLEKENLFFYCKDFGPGVEEEELHFLRKKYFRGKSVDGKQGAGLGLYISDYLMEQMEGTLECRNRTDGFEVILSLKVL